MVVPNHDGLPDCRDFRGHRPDRFGYFDDPAAFARTLAAANRLRGAFTTEHYEKVREFARLAGNDIPDKPADLTPEQRILCARLIMEEAMETVAALGVRMNVMPEFLNHHPVEFRGLGFTAEGEMNRVEAVDGCCDTRVVSTFALVLMGVQDNAVQNAVDDNNLAKFDPEKGGYRDPITHKWIKPPNHPKPPIAEILAAQSAQRGASDAASVPDVLQPGLPPADDEGAAGCDLEAG